MHVQPFDIWTTSSCINETFWTNLWLPWVSVTVALLQIEIKSSFEQLFCVLFFSVLHLCHLVNTKLGSPPFKVLLKFYSRSLRKSGAQLNENLNQGTIFLAATLKKNNSLPSSFLINTFPFQSGFFHVFTPTFCFITLHTWEIPFYSIFTTL